MLVAADRPEIDGDALAAVALADVVAVEDGELVAFCLLDTDEGLVAVDNRTLAPGAAVSVDDAVEALFALLLFDKCRRIASSDANTRSRI